MTKNPFRIDGPAKISFSGGRTSGLMLRRVINAWEGTLPDDVHVLFANTGKERRETLEFIHEIETRWQIPIHWVEREACTCVLAHAAPIAHTPACPFGSEDAPGYREVTYATAARDGTPFDALIRERNFLPNPVTRFCTQELKIRVMKKWMLARGYEHWTNIVGLRADEPRRVARIRSSSEKDRWDIALPLADAGITVADVDAFWRAQPFDLRLQKWEGNCDLCFLKGRAKRTRILRDHPDLAAWWIAQEQRELRDPPKRPLTTKIIEHDASREDAQPMLPLGRDALRRILIPKERRNDRTGTFRYDAPPIGRCSRSPVNPSSGGTRPTSTAPRSTISATVSATPRNDHDHQGSP